MTYTMLKSIHVACAVVSYALFVMRGLWLFRFPHRLRARWVRIAPHAVDALLLASAVALVVLTRQYPGPLSWLNAKIAAVVLYIALGMAAFRWLKTERARFLSWILAQFAFFYIVLTAVTKTPWPL